MEPFFESRSADGARVPRASSAVRDAAKCPVPAAALCLHFEIAGMVLNYDCRASLPAGHTGPKYGLVDCAARFYILLRSYRCA